MPVDETWVDSARGRTGQLTEATERAATLTPTDDEVPYILLYQVPLGGTLSEEDIYGDADCITLAPGEAVPAQDITNPEIVTRVINCRSPPDEWAAHRVQVAAYCVLLERTLAEGPCDINCRIEVGVLTQTHATSNPQS